MKLEETGYPKKPRCQNAGTSQRANGCLSGSQCHTMAAGLLKTLLTEQHNHQANSHVCKEAHHNGGPPVAQHIAAHVQEAAAEVVAVLAQLRQLAGAAIAAVLAAQQADGAQYLLRCWRRQAGRVQVPRRPMLQVLDQLPVAPASQLVNRAALGCPLLQHLL